LRSHRLPRIRPHVVQIACANMSRGIHVKLAESFPSLEFTIQESGFIRVDADQPVHVGPLVRFLEDHEAEVVEAKRMRPSLEDIFVQITGIEADAMCKEKEKKGGGQ
jgi:ABC-2 type transport system ATP-binding protein